MKALVGPFGHIELRKKAIIAVSICLGLRSNLEVGNQPNSGRVGRHQTSPEPPLPCDGL